MKKRILGIILVLLMTLTGCKSVNGEAGVTEQPTPTLTASVTQETTIAIMDSGLDVNHPDIKDALFTFSADQQKRFGCGPHGINMEPAPKGRDPEEYAKDITDHDMHGTHVAGIIAAGVNGFGVSGVEKGAKIFSVRVFGEDGKKQDKTSIVRGLEWLATVAEEINLKAVNISLGSGHSQLVHTDAVNRLGAMGVNVVYASGNETLNVDEAVDMGAQNNSPYVINVDASDMGGKPAVISNYGRMTTDVCAPGMQVLSTVPSVLTRYQGKRLTENSDRTQVFLQNTDPAHLANGSIESFDGAEPDVIMYDVCPVNKDGSENKKAKRIGSKATGSGLGFTDNTSWSMKIKSLKNDVDESPAMAGDEEAGRNFWMAVPVKEGVRPAWLGYAATINDQSNVNGGLAGVLCSKKKSTGEEVPTEIDMSYDNALEVADITDTSIPRGIARVSTEILNGFSWSSCSFNLAGFVRELQYIHGLGEKDRKKITHKRDPGDITGVYIWKNKGKSYILCRYAVAEAENSYEITNKTCLYLDDIAVADEQAATGAYAYMSGTSMAAPMVTAALAIIAKDEPENSSMSEKVLSMVALERAAKLMTLVDYDDSLLEKCSTGGRLNFHGETEFTQKAPLFTYAAMQDKSLYLGGFFFGESGKLLVDGKEVATSQWTDESIVADVSSLDAGSHVAMVINSDEKRRQIVFSVKGDLLYENDLSLPLENERFVSDYTDVISGGLVASGRYIFALGTDANKNLIALWRFDIKEDSWFRCKNIPKEIKAYRAENSGMVILDNMLYMYSGSKNDGANEGLMYRYDIKKDTWAKAFRKDLPAGSQIFQIKKQVFLAKGGTIFTLNVKTGKMKETKAELPKIQFMSEAKLAVSGNTVYIYGTTFGKDYSEQQTMLRLTWNKGKNSFKVENLKKVAKKLKEYPEKISMTGIGKGVAIVAPGSEDTYATYIVKNGKNTASTFKKTACYHHIYMPLSTYIGGQHYVMGINCTEPETLFFRSTEM